MIRPGLLAQSAPSINPGGAVNAASYAAGAPLVPGGIVSVFGNFQLAVMLQQGTDVELPNASRIEYVVLVTQ